MLNKKFDKIAAIEILVIFSILISFLIIFSVSFNGLSGITGYATYFFNTNHFSISSATFINNCTNINFPGEYYLQNNITDSSISYCIDIQVNNIILDCQGNMVDGDGIADYGVHISRPVPDITNITIRNCILSDWDSAGIYIGHASGNIIYNNLFNNTNNFNLSSAGQNNWNITKILGESIVGGNYLGGNFWADPNGTGFSETCADADIDGICDSNYTLATNNVDYYPLTYPDYAPFVELVSPVNGTSTKNTTLNFTCNATDDKNLVNVTLYIWNSTNEIFYQNSTDISGVSNSSTWEVSGFVPDSYTWNCLAYDNVSQLGWGESNFSLTVLIDSPPSAALVNPTDGKSTTSTSLDFTCDATDDINLVNITLYVWDSTDAIFYQNSSDISGISNSSTWQVNGFALGSYKWNCEAYDNVSQNDWGDSNYSLTITKQGGGPPGEEVIKEEKNVTENVTTGNVTGEKEKESYTTDELGKNNIGTTGYIANTSTEGDFTRKGTLKGSISNNGTKNLEEVDVVVFEKISEPGSTESNGANNVNNGANLITGSAVGDVVNLPVEEGKLEIKPSKTKPLIIQKFIQDYIGPGFYVSTSQVSQKPLRTEPIRKYIASLLKPGESITFEINISAGLTVEDKILVMEFKSFNKTFAVKEIVLKAEPPVFGFSLEKDEENNLADAYVIISNINQEESEYFVGIDIIKPAEAGYERKAGIKGFFESLSKGPSAMYYDYLGPYTLKTDESTLLTQRFIFNEVPIGTYIFDATLYYDNVPLSKISNNIHVKR